MMIVFRSSQHARTCASSWASGDCPRCRFTTNRAGVWFIFHESRSVKTSFPCVVQRCKVKVDFCVRLFLGTVVSSDGGVPYSSPSLENCTVYDCVCAQRISLDKPHFRSTVAGWSFIVRKHPASAFIFYFGLFLLSILAFVFGLCQRFRWPSCLCYTLHARWIVTDPFLNNWCAVTTLTHHVVQFKG